MAPHTHTAGSHTLKAPKNTTAARLPVATKRCGNAELVLAICVGTYRIGAMVQCGRGGPGAHIIHNSTFHQTQHMKFSRNKDFG